MSHPIVHRQLGWSVMLLVWPLVQACNPSSRYLVADAPTGSQSRQGPTTAAPPGCKPVTILALAPPERRLELDGQLHLGILGPLIVPSEYRRELSLDGPSRFHCRVTAAALRSRVISRSERVVPINVAVPRSPRNEAEAVCRETSSGTESKDLECEAPKAGRTEIVISSTDPSELSSAFGLSCWRSTSPRPASAAGSSGSAGGGGAGSAGIGGGHKEPSHPAAALTRPLKGVSEGQSASSRLLMLTCPGSLAEEVPQLKNGAQGRVSIGRYSSTFHVVETEDCQIEIDAVPARIPESALMRKAPVRLQVGR